MYQLKLISSLALAVTLAACGGGSSSTSPVPTPTPSQTAEGVYSGSLTGSVYKNFQMLILENGDTWSMYGTQTNSAFGVSGFVQGTGISANNSSFTSSDAKDFGYSPAKSGTINATFNASAKTISGNVSSAVGSVSFSGGAPTGSLYNYATPAAISSITGAWSVSTIDGATIALNILQSGNFTAQVNGGCNFNGTITPRPSGKNVFNVALTFGSAPCTLAGQSATGIALTYPLSSGKTQLLMVAVDSTRTNGTAAFGIR